MRGEIRTPGAARVLAIEGGRGERRVRIGGSEKAAAVALCLLLLIGHLAFGAARREIALGFAAAEGLLLAVLALACGWARRQLEGAWVLRWPALGFALVFVAALLSLTPFAPGGSHPLWSYVQASPAAVLDKAGVYQELVRLAALACMFLTAWTIAGDDDRARWFLQLFVIATGLFAIWAFVSHVADPGVLFGVVALPYAGERLSAAFLSANSAATYFGMGSLISLAALIAQTRRRGPDDRWVSGATVQRAAPCLIALAFSAASLVLTASRGGFLAAAVALGVFILWEGSARRWRLLGLQGLGLLAIGAVLLVLLGLGGAPLLDRVLNPGGETARQAISTAHWDAFLASPWMGYGLGGFDAVNRMVTSSQNYPYLWNVHAAHNVYLQWLEEAGILGAVAMFCTVGLILALIVRGAARRVRMTTWVRGLAAASLVPLIHGLSDYGFQVPSIAALFTCVLGLATGLALRPASARR